MNRLFLQSTLWLSISSLLFYGCAQSLSPFQSIITSSTEIRMNKEALNDELKLLYITCGMIIIEYKDEAIFFDPYFSYQKITSIPFGVKTRKRFYDPFKETVESTIDKNKVTTGFISHSHYDHLMDLPVLLHDQYFPNLRIIYGNEFVEPMMKHHLDKGVAIHTITEKQLYNPIKPDTANWMPVSKSIEVMPIASMHAPHKFGVLAMKGPVDKNYFQKPKLKDPYARSKGFKWDVGCAYSFIIRLKKSDNTYFKIFIQTSASEEKYGSPPEGEKADIAIMCFASIQEAENYPFYFVEKTGAQKLILIHWEDFFRYPKDEHDIKIVRGTNKRIANERINALQKLPSPPDVLMPRPGSLLTIKH